MQEKVYNRDLHPQTCRCSQAQSKAHLLSIIIKTMMTRMTTMRMTSMLIMRCNEDYRPGSLGAVQQRRENHPEHWKVKLGVERNQNRSFVQEPKFLFPP